MSVLLDLDLMSIPLDVDPMSALLYGRNSTSFRERKNPLPKPLYDASP